MTTTIDKIIRAYAEDPAGLTPDECQNFGWTERQCEVWMKALGKGSEGIITSYDQVLLEKAGFTKSFLQELAGKDGKKALQNRVRWMKEHIGTKLFRSDYNDETRNAMATELGQIGSDAKESVPFLLKILKNGNPEIRASAARSLGQIRSNADIVVPSLAAALTDPDVYVRWFAARALGRIGKEAQAAVPALVMAMQDESVYVRRSVVTSLGQIELFNAEVVGAMIAVLEKEGEEELILGAIQVLGKAGPNAKEAVPILAAELQKWQKFETWKESRDKGVNWYHKSYQGFIERYSDSSSSRRKALLHALVQMPPTAESIIPVFEEVEEYIHWRSSLGYHSDIRLLLSSFGPDAKDTVPALIEALKDENESVRGNAIKALGQIGPGAEKAISPLFSIIKNKENSGDMRRETAEVLGKIIFGYNNEEVVSTLIGILEDEKEEWDIRKNAALALGRVNFGTETVLSPVIEKYFESAVVEEGSKSVLSAFGSAAVPFLVSALNDKRIDARKLAIMTLAEISERDDKVKWDKLPVSDVKMGLIYGDRVVQINTARLLGKIGPGAEEAIPWLVRALLRADEEYLKRSIIRALGKIGSEQALSGLVRYLNEGKYKGSLLLSIDQLDQTEEEAKRQWFSHSTTSHVVRALADMGSPAVPHFLRWLEEGEALDQTILSALALMQMKLHTDRVSKIFLMGLEDKNEGMKLAAALALSQMKLHADAATPILLDSLKKSKREKNGEFYRGIIINALSRFGFHNGETILEFIAACRDDYRPLRESGEKALLKLGPDAKEAIPDLVTASKDKDEEVRRLAAVALSKIGPNTTEAILALLNWHRAEGSTPTYIYESALNAKFGDDAVFPLIELLNSPDQKIKTFALEVLGRIGPDAKEAVPALMDALKDENESVRSKAVEALGQIGPDAKEAVPVLFNAMLDVLEYAERGGVEIPESKNRFGHFIDGLKYGRGSGDGSMRRRSLRLISEKKLVISLIEMGPDGIRAFFRVINESFEDMHIEKIILSLFQNFDSSIVPYLVNLLHDKNKYNQYSAIRALGQIGPVAKLAVPVLAAILKNDNTSEPIKKVAAGALDQIDISPEINVLKLKHDDPETRQNAARALGRSGPFADKAVPQLLQSLLYDNENDVRVASAVALKNIVDSDATWEVCREFSRALQYDQDARVREEIAKAFGFIGSSVPEIFRPHLVRALWDKNVKVRSAAAWAVGNIGGPKAVGALGIILKNEKEDKEVREHAAGAMVRIGLASVPELITILQNEKSVDIKLKAISILGGIGSEAKDAVPVLIQTLKDPVLKVRKEASMALSSIGRDAVPLLIEALKNDNAHVRLGAVEALGGLESGSVYGFYDAKYDAKDVIFAISDIKKMSLTDKDPRCRKSAEKVLNRLMGQLR
ncbi:MAG: HEAT repeat domain-containing protein [Deltaproteobacteria bacterium]|nr:HEAT repeat domain-containing protein [Deltaproteobacteria bacterium]